MFGGLKRKVDVFIFDEGSDKVEHYQGFLEWDNNHKTWYLNIPKLRTKIPKIDLTDLWKDTIFLYREGLDKYKKIVFDKEMIENPKTKQKETNINVRVHEIPKEAIVTKVMMDIEESLKKPNWFEKLFPYLMFIIFALLLIGMFAFGIQQLMNMQKEYMQQNKEIVDKMQALTDAINKIVARAEGYKEVPAK